MGVAGGQRDKSPRARYWGPAMKAYPYAHAPRLPSAQRESSPEEPAANPPEAVEAVDPVGSLGSVRSAGSAGSVEPVEPVEPRGLVPDASGPVELEVGSGRGWFTVERVEEDPNVGIIGLEIKRKWATIVDDRLRARGLAGRARVFAEDARLAMGRFPCGSFSRIYVHFPDPWWKKRHRKRMVVTPEFAAEVARLLHDGGEFFVQTDVEERAEAYESAIAQVSSLRPSGPNGGARVEASPCAAKSPRERRAIADGLPVLRLLYTKESKEA